MFKEVVIYFLEKSSRKFELFLQSVCSDNFQAELDKTCKRSDLIQNFKCQCGRTESARSILARLETRCLIVDIL